MSHPRARASAGFSLVAALILAAIVIIVGVLVVRYGSGGPAAGPANSTTMRALFDAGKDVTCTVSRSDARASTEGTVYVSGANLRSDSTTTIGDRTIVSHMVRKGDSAYLWSDTPGAIGLKMTIAAAATGSAARPVSRLPGFDVAGGYACSPWSPDQSKFELPAEVKFRDLPAPGTPGAAAAKTSPTAKAGVSAKVSATTTASADRCAVCEKIPDAAAKARCEAALSC